MSSWVAAARQAFPAECAVDECQDAGCGASLDGVSEDRVLIDLDCEPLGLAAATRADFVLAAGSDTLACIELKRGQPRKAAQQLRATAAYLEGQLPLEGREPKFRAILVHGLELRANQLRYFSRERITFRERQHEIQLLRCGDALAKVLGTP